MYPPCGPIAESPTVILGWSEMTPPSSSFFQALAYSEFFSKSSVLMKILVFELGCSTYLFHGRTQRPQHFSIPFRCSSASFMSWLIWSKAPSHRSSCSRNESCNCHSNRLPPWSSNMTRVLIPASLLSSQRASIRRVDSRDWKKKIYRCTEWYGWIICL